ncbi:MAG: phosphoribosylformylglycinamidine synthase [Nitrospirae bacterium GWF2_44_13]|nr:MAG: phosphoribosylformylglycinamidine synthase [Nitrospirae bacterium GWF2_44_13]OGW65826.1 MAG: phosphoribosylformylglycinamidine synthase [Nitrospirae bacterium RIFOXYA2_FULL_44_9]
MVRQGVSPDINDIETEHCFNIEATAPLTTEELNILRWLLAETFEPENFSERSFLAYNSQLSASVLEAGPRMNFTTAWSTNAVSVCHACGLKKIRRIERSRRYRLVGSIHPFTDSSIHRFLALVHDRMTECPYPETLETFETGIKPEPAYTVPLIEEGPSALKKINTEMGLGLDDWDIEYYYSLFVKDLKRNPTNVECFDLSQSNSEHSRHWFFRGQLIVDGKEISENLMQIIKQPLKANPNNSVIAFKDNSSGIKGYKIKTIIPENVGRHSRFKEAALKYHLILTAETHNFPSGVAPFPGAETGTGGRIRDVQATGRGAHVMAGTAAYCVGNLRIPGYKLPWEDESFEYPNNLASPLQIEIEASNGASDYGNKFGEPVIQGFTRSFGMRLADGERREWIKPIMFTAGIGQMDARHIEKGQPEKGMLVTKIGGPAYRIGMGGGAASSMIQGENIAELDFNAVQRGDAEMEQKLNRVIRACVELGSDNPIISIHDQGAGGNCNVVKEIIYPAGAKIEIRKIQIGDNTLSVLEIWGAEYQEQNALLIKPDKANIFEELCRREKVPFSFIGQITGDGYIVLHDENDGSAPVNLDLEKILGDMPQKTFKLERVQPKLEPLKLPEDITVRDALDRVLRLVSVGSKRFLTNKVDRSVTGLIARQQCAGPLHLTVSDVAVIAQSHFGLTGAAISIGEQPIKTLINPSATARLSVGEALTNIVWAKISKLEDIKCSGNWMWAAKLPGEGARLYDAAVALRDLMLELGIAIDGGKDSLSMAAIIPKSSGGGSHRGDSSPTCDLTVKSPGTLVISAYATCPDITKVVTPDIKKPGKSRLLFIDLGNSKNRLGGTALAQVYNQIGNESPDVDDPKLLKKAFNAVQKLISDNLIIAGHDRSDGGLITTLLEMAFAGNCGVEVEMQDAGCRMQDEIMSRLFSEELGLVVEYLPKNEKKILAELKNQKVPCHVVGRTTVNKKIKVKSNGKLILNEDMRVLRGIWEETSYQLERLQMNPDCADEEKKNIYARRSPQFKITFKPDITSSAIIKRKNKPSVAIVREEGSNSDREMTSAFYQAGFDVWDTTMTDFFEGKVSLDNFKGMAFVGGFSYADVLDSAKGWAGVIKFNKEIYEQFQKFYNRPDTFSLSVCNGCQLAALLGWIPWQGIEDKYQPRFIHNVSGRFESRFSTVKIFPSPSIMLKGMEGSTLGIWVAHGEGRAYFPKEDILNKIGKDSLAPVRYVDDKGKITESYPFNPNGSVNGIAALCSPDGRHLAIMPHPERTFQKWNWAWMPEEWKKNLKASPWLRLFQNARKWCEEE